MAEPARATSNEESRRQHDRAVLKARVTMTSESNFYTGLLNNISEGGIFAATFNLLPLGTRVDLEFSLPDGEAPIAVQAEVRWIREYDPLSDAHPGMGLRFLTLPDEVKARIERFVARRETLFYDD